MKYIRTYKVFENKEELYKEISEDEFCETYELVDFEKRYYDMFDYIPFNKSFAKSSGDKSIYGFLIGFNIKHKLLNHKTHPFGKISVIVNIYQTEDEYFDVKVKQFDWSLSNTDDSVKYYRCDQIDGLKKFLDDFTEEYLEKKA